MADTYIDTNEVSEYGEFFYNESQKLEGLSEIFHINKLRERVRSLLDAYQKDRASDGTLDGARKDTKTATAEARDVLTRFFHFLGSLKTGAVDKGAFFKNGKLGEPSSLKSADVLTKLEAVILGFEAKGNASFKDRDDWKKELSESYAALKTSLDTKESKRTDAARSTTQKSASYDAFVEFYHGVAKPAVKGLLTELKRGEEYRLFFKDLQVKETPQDKKKQSEAAKKGAETKKNK